MISFKVLGVNVRIEMLFIATITIFLLVDKSNIGVMSICACILHESGHILMLFLFRCKPKELVFDIIGIKLVNSNNKLSEKKDLCVLVAGSFINFFIFFLLFGFTSSLNNLGLFAVCNLVLGVFNLLPVSSFDGGKILEIILMRFFSYRTVDVLCRATEILFTLAILVVFILTIIIKKPGITSLVITCYLIFAVVIRFNRK
ncbi:MAG: site-2 protease family protein [Oscillospiraceae bacterium]